MLVVIKPSTIPKRQRENTKAPSGRKPSVKTLLKTAFQKFILEKSARDEDDDSDPIVQDEHVYIHDDDEQEGS